MAVASASVWIIPLVSAVVSIVGIVSGAVIAIKVARMNADRELAGMRQQSLDARRGELNQLLDEAVQHLHAGYRILLAIRHERGKDPPDWSRVRELGEELDDETGFVAQYGLRVDVRTPAGNKITKVQRDANRIFLNYNGAYREYLAKDLLEQKNPPRPPQGGVSGGGQGAPPFMAEGKRVRPLSFCRFCGDRRSTVARLYLQGFCGVYR